ncbi:thioredoxin family protein [Streptomyces olivochromogenes]|uniref:thioredoxin family protein n=1 Tax=Streptomyces olivochromogenes TaxID=1963 RepID=UPI0036DE5A02
MVWRERKLVDGSETGTLSRQRAVGAPLKSDGGFPVSVNAIKSKQDFASVIDCGKPILIEFWAPWCGPSRTISPIFEKHASDPKNVGIEFYRVDIDEQEQIAQEVGIRGMPVFMLFKDGDKKAEVIGADPGKLEALVIRARPLR